MEHHVSDCSCGPFSLMRCLPPVIIQLGAERETEGERAEREEGEIYSNMVTEERKGKGEREKGKWRMEGK